MASEGMASMNQKNAGASHVDLIEVLKKQGNPPGSHAASILLEAVMNNNKVFCAGGAGSDVLGIVALLASVEDDLLNRYSQMLSLNVAEILHFRVSDSYMCNYT